jgi:hypothetical protein
LPIKPLFAHHQMVAIAVHASPIRGQLGRQPS